MSKIIKNKTSEKSRREERITFLNNVISFVEEKRENSMEYLFFLSKRRECAIFFFYLYSIKVYYLDLNIIVSVRLAVRLHASLALPKQERNKKSRAKIRREKES